MPASSHPLTPTRRVGTVISISPTPTPTVEVQVGGDTTTTVFVPYLESYSPVVGDYVVLLGTGGDYVAVGAIQPALTTWTPTPTNLTIGNGTVVARYALLGPLLFMTYNLVFGSTTAITGNVAWAIPAGYTSTAGQEIPMRVSSSASAVQWMGLVDIASGGTTLNPWLSTSSTDTRLLRLGAFALTMGTGAFIRFNGGIWIQ